MGFTLETSIPALTVFFTGDFQLLLPPVCCRSCPFIWLSLRRNQNNRSGVAYFRYPRKKVFLNTVFLCWA